MQQVSIFTLPIQYKFESQKPGWISSACKNRIHVPSTYDLYFWTFKKWSSRLPDNLSDCLTCAPKTLQVSSTGFEPMTSETPVHCSHQLSNEASQMWAHLSGFIAQSSKCEGNFLKIHLSTTLHKHSFQFIFTSVIIAFSSKMTFYFENNFVDVAG